jgi:2-polyprenyl-3-methyl-5-hydroxy-6-metoxy-1,4-benzoquinol methylase
MELSKNQDYYGIARTEILPLLPAAIDRVLDVGCGNGVTGAYLKQNRDARHVTGVEVIPAAAAEARRFLDEVLLADLNTGGFPAVSGKFDLVLCLDVLEHLVDPWAELKKIVEHLSPEGTLIVSVPNLRHFKTSLPLFFRGEFRYETSGVRDSTHLRFFTRKSAIALVEAAGLSVSAVVHTGRPKFSKTWFLNLFTLGLFREFFDFQYMVKAQRAR